MRSLPFLGAIVLTGVSGVVALADPSFDCGKARTADEKAICADPVLADIDGIVARAFSAYTPSFRGKAQVARDLLADRAACGGDRACIAAVQEGSLSTFTYDNDALHQPPPFVPAYALALTGHKATRFAAGAAGPGKALPSRPGECVRTRIVSITTRFGEAIAFENQDAGTAIGFANGGYQVSYGRGDAFAEVAAGDDAVVCLMSIPRDCPAGDERGRLYYTLDLRTQTQWVLPDSQHLCGGA